MIKIRNFFRRLSQTVWTILFIGATVSILAAPSYAIINRLVGGNLWDGDGLIFRGASGNKDSVHVLYGWGFSIDNDTLKPNITWLDDSLLALSGGTMSGAIDMGDKDIFNIERVECDTFEISGDLIIDLAGTGLSVTSNVLNVDYSEIAITDFDGGNWKVLYTDADGDVTELPLGAAGTYLKSTGASAAPEFDTPGGSGDVTDVWDCASGDCNTLTIGESEYLIGGAVDGSTDPYISLPQGADVSSVTGEGRISWDSDGDILYVGDGAAVNWILSEEDIDASSELLAIMDDETGTGVLVFGTSPTFTTGITVPDNSISDEELDEGATFTWTGTQDFTSATTDLGTGAVDAAGEISAEVIEESHLKVTGGAAVDEDIFTYESTTGDFQWHTPTELGLLTTYTQFWGENDLSVSWGTDDSVDVFFPLCEKFGDVTHPYFVRTINSAAGNDQDDQKDTLVFSGRLPLGFTAGIDSITIGYRTSTTTAATSGLTVLVYAMKDLVGFAPEDTVKAVGEQVASGSAGVWDWLTINMADSSDVGAGSWIMVQIECEVDCTAQPETVDIERPYFWGVAK